MKIIVVGAGIGGLRAASMLSRGGATVSVYEKEPKENLSYDWTDETDRDLFEKFSLPLPEGSYRGANVAVVAPFGKKPLRLPDVPLEKRGWCVERRLLTKELIDDAKKNGVAFHFSTAVDSLVFGKDGVSGVRIGADEIPGDLVIDSSGVFSSFRASLPPCFGVTEKPRANEVFYVFRGIYAPDEKEAESAEFKRKVYLKHLGEQGISWCMLEANGEVNVLIGRTHKLNDEDIQSGLDDLRKNNPFLTEKLIRGGRGCAIPIRYCITKAVAPGYAAIGDAAFMTIPLKGSGISRSLYAADMLSETVLEAGVSESALWKYQVKYYKRFGAADAGVDFVKRSLLRFPSKDLRFLFDSEVISETDVAAISANKDIKITAEYIFDKLKRGSSNIPALLRASVVLAGAMRGKAKAESTAKSIPEEFNKEKISAWQTAMDGIFD